MFSSPIKFASLCLGVLCQLQLFSQSSLDAAGNTAVTNTAEVSFSLGQFAFTSIETDDVTITQGVQQSFQSISLKGPDEDYFQMRVFPNPVFSHLQLEFDHLKEPVTVSVFNAEGKYLFKQNISTKTARVPFHNQSGGVYILSISMNSKTLKTFKIIKKS